MSKLLEKLKDKDIIMKVGKVVYIKENVSFLHDTQLMDDAAPLIIKKKKRDTDEIDEEESLPDIELLDDVYDDFE